MKGAGGGERESESEWRGWKWEEIASENYYGLSITISDLLAVAVSDVLPLCCCCC